MILASKGEIGILGRYITRWRRTLPPIIKRQLHLVSQQTLLKLPPATNNRATTANTATTGLPLPGQVSTEPSDTAPAAQPPSTLSGMTLSLQQMPMTNRYEITAPALLQGTWCHVDASTEPARPNLHPKLAGLGVFILNFQEQPAQAIYIKAKLEPCTSVIMAC